MSANITQNGFTAELSAQLDHLKKQFSKNLIETEQRLEDIIAKVSAQGLDPSALTDLFVIVHNLGGSAPMYGFHEVAMLAVEIEETLLSCATPASNDEVFGMSIMLAIDSLTEEIRSVVEPYCRG